MWLELLSCFVSDAGLYLINFNVIYKCACVRACLCVCVCERECVRAWVWCSCCGRVYIFNHVSWRVPVLLFDSVLCYRTSRHFSCCITSSKGGICILLSSHHTQITDYRPAPFPQTDLWLECVAIVNLLRQISLTFWVEANESLDLVALIRLSNKRNGRNVFLLPVEIIF